MGCMIAHRAVPLVQENLAMAVGGAEVGLLPGFLAAAVPGRLVRKAFLAHLPAVALLDHPEIASDHAGETDGDGAGLRQPIEATSTGLRIIAIPSRLAMKTAVRSIGTPKA